MTQAVVIIPGLDGAGRHFAPLVAQLESRGWRVLVVEHCREEPWLGKQPLVEDLVDQVLWEMNTAGMGRAVVAGESFGSTAALLLARRHPERVSRLVILGGFAHLPFAKRRALLIALYPLLAVVARFLPHTLLQWGMQRWNPFVRRSDPEVLQQAGRQMHVPTARCMLAKIRLCLTFDARPWLHEILVPTVAITGTRDETVPPSCAREVARGVGSGKLVVVPYKGHLAAHVDPGPVIAAVEGR